MNHEFTFEMIVWCRCYAAHCIILTPRRGVYLSRRYPNWSHSIHDISLDAPLAKGSPEAHDHRRRGEQHNPLSSAIHSRHACPPMTNPQLNTKIHKDWWRRPPNSCDSAPVAALGGRRGSPCRHRNRHVAPGRSPPMIVHVLARGTPPLVLLGLKSMRRSDISAHSSQRRMLLSRCSSTARSARRKHTAPYTLLLSAWAWAGPAQADIGLGRAAVGTGSAVTKDVYRPGMTRDD